MAAPTLVEQLGELATFPLERLPGAVVASVPQRVLDIAGICVRATTLDTSRAVLDHVGDQGGRAIATTIGIEERLPAPLAAFANGVLAHSLDYDDTHLPSIVHPSASVIPAALAAGQAGNANGAATLSAIAAGIEIAVRLGMAGYDTVTSQSIYFEHGQHATSICGAIGAAAAAAVLLGGDAGDAAHAMAVAASMASGIIEANRTGGTVKRIHCGLAAQAGVTAAQLVRRGITGAPTALEGRFGFFRAWLRDEWNQHAVTDGLGSEWCVADIFYKPYPANHFTHAGIDAALALRRRGIRATDIASAHLAVATPTVRTIGEPLDLKQRPETGYQAQFSGPFAVAAAFLTDGGPGSGLGLGLDDFDDQRACDPEYRALMARITVGSDPRCDAIFPMQFPAVLTVHTTDGRVLEEVVRANRGGPERPLTSGELAVKFADNVEGLLTPEATTAVVSAVGGLAELGSLDAILTPLNPAARASPDGS